MHRPNAFRTAIPRLIASPYPVEFVYAPGLITMLHEVAHNVRFIHMDGKPAPADTPRSFLGYSVGHWEGNTLVIVTDHFNDRTQIDEESLSHGLQLKVTERMTKFTNKYGGVEIREPDHDRGSGAFHQAVDGGATVSVARRHPSRRILLRGKQSQCAGEWHFGGQMNAAERPDRTRVPVRSLAGAAGASRQRIPGRQCRYRTGV